MNKKGAIGSKLHYTSTKSHKRISPESSRAGSGTEGTEGKEPEPELPPKQKEVTSSASHNVMRFVVRQLLHWVLDKPHSVVMQARELANLNDDEFSMIQDRCRYAQEAERQRSRKQSHKDYTKFTNQIQRTPGFREVYNVVLRKIREEFQQGSYHKIAKANYEIYRTTIQKLYATSCDFLHRPPI